MDCFRQGFRAFYFIMENRKDKFQNWLIRVDVNQPNSTHAQKLPKEDGDIPYPLTVWQSRTARYLVGGINRELVSPSRVLIDCSFCCMARSHCVLEHGRDRCRVPHARAAR